MTLKSNFAFYITDRLEKGDTTVSISNDLETDTSVTLSTETSILITYEDDNTTIERCKGTATWGTLTLSERWLTPDDPPVADASYKKDRRPGAICYVVLFPDDVVENDATQTVTGAKTFSAAIAFTLSMQIPVFADATARTAAIPSPANGMMSYLTDTGLMYWYLAWSWVSLWTNGTFANASETLAGKKEDPTDAEVTAGTAIWGTWATMSPTTVQQKKSISLKQSTSTVVDANEWVINQWWEDFRVLQSILSTYYRSFLGTAWENLTAWDLAYLDLDWSAYKTVRKASAVAQLGTLTGVDVLWGNWYSTRCEYLSDNTAIVCHKKASDNFVYWNIVTWDRWTPTVWSSATISAALEWAYWFDLCVLSSTLFVVTYKLASDDKPYAVACTVSGSTITAWTPVKMYDTETVSDNAGVLCCKVSSTSFACSFANVTSSDPLMVVGTISGTTITAGTASQLKATTSTYPVLLAYIQNWVIVSAYTDGTNLFIRPATISGTTITLKTELATGLAYRTWYCDQLITIETGRILFVDAETSWNTRIVVLNIADQSAWTVANVVNTFYITNDYASQWMWQMIYLWENKVAYLSMVTNGSDMRLRIMDLWQNDCKTLFDTVIAWTVADIALCKLTTRQDKILMIYGAWSNLNYSLYWNTENQFCWVVQTTTAAAWSVPITNTWPTPVSWLTAWLPYYVGDDWAVATTGTKQIWVALTTTSLLLK